MEKNISELFKNLQLKESFKKDNEANPVYTQRFGADPYALIYEDTLYLYMTADTHEYEEDGSVKENTYSKIREINIVSTKDLVNFTDHGSVKVAGPEGISKAASNSWAPAVCCKKVNGKDQFFMYFANGGNGIGVIQADSPAGPFRDPLGTSFITREVPNCSDVVWLFDPAVLVDEDDQAYLYFGGGVPENKASDPGTARAVKLGDDMISIVGEPVKINPPYLFEDSGIHKFNNKYYYTYCTNFSVDEEGTKKYGFTNGTICSMVSDNPLGPFEFKEAILKNPGEYFGLSGNNHHCVFKYKGQWYMTYHARALEGRMGIPKGYRSTHINAINMQEDGTIGDIPEDLTGCKQLENVNPFEKTNATTCQLLAGLDTAMLSDNGECYLTKITSGAYLKVSGVDFGKTGATKLELTLKNVKASENQGISIRLDSKDAKDEAAFFVPDTKNGEFEKHEFILDTTISGVHDIYFVFAGSDFEVLDWKFI